MKMNFKKTLAVTIILALAFGNIVFGMLVWSLSSQNAMLIQSNSNLQEIVNNIGQVVTTSSSENIDNMHPLVTNTSSSSSTSSTSSASSTSSGPMNY